MRNNFPPFSPYCPYETKLSFPCCHSVRQQHDLTVCKHARLGRTPCSYRLLRTESGMGASKRPSFLATARANLSPYPKSIRAVSTAILIHGRQVFLAVYDAVFDGLNDVVHRHDGIHVNAEFLFRFAHGGKIAVERLLLSIH